MAHLIAYIIFKYKFLSSKKIGNCYFVQRQKYSEGCLAWTSPVHHHKHNHFSFTSVSMGWKRHEVNAEPTEKTD